MIASPLLIPLLLSAMFWCASNASPALYKHIERLSRRRGGQLTAQNVMPTMAPNLETRFFTQLVDHFDSQNSAHFSQRYTVDWFGLDPSKLNSTSKPVFLVIGGEFPLDGSAIVNTEATALAKQHDAILIGLEHRYYGASVVQPLTKEGLRYLTTEQALADISSFVRAQRSGGPNALLEGGFTGKWFVFGCSYGGVLAAWFRLKYPHQTVAALSASSPVQAIVSFSELDTLVAKAAGKKCADVIRTATHSIEERTDSAAKLQTVLKDFGCSAQLDRVDFLYVVADAVAFGIMTNSQYQLQNKMCDYFTNALTEDRYEAYKDYVKFLFTYTNTTCYDWALSSFTKTTPSKDDYMRTWLWQTCTELGYFQTAPKDKPLRSHLITVQYHLDVCQRLFNFTKPQLPTVEAINADFGGNTNFTSSNVIFSNGGNDPWRALSVTSPLGPTVPSVLIDGQAHCANWYRAKSNDSEALTQGRQLVSSYVSYFLNPNSICGKCKNNATCEVAPEGNHATKVGSRCVCYEGWYGDDCSQDVFVIAGGYCLIVASGCAILFACIGIVAGRKIKQREVAKERRAFERIIE